MHIEKSYAGTGDIRGKIANSVDGNGIAGLLLELRKGINVHSGTVIRSTTTEDDGRYTISQLEAGNYTIEISADGYQTSYMTVVALGGRINEQQNGTINPINVKVYKGSGLFAEFFVPNEAGTLWEVFEIDGNNLTPINTMSYHSNEDTVQKMSKAKK